jgi:hypothetical protein
LSFVSFLALKDVNKQKYGGSAVLQDSPQSLGVTASLDASVYASNQIVQLHMFAATPCQHNCSIARFFSSFIAHARLQTNITSSNGLTVSSLTSFPLGAMQDSLGYEILFCFVNQGRPSADSDVIPLQLYGPPLAPCLYPVLFPARASF